MNDLLLITISDGTSHLMEAHFPAPQRASSRRAHLRVLFRLPRTLCMHPPGRAVIKANSPPSDCAVCAGELTTESAQPFGFRREKGFKPKKRAAIWWKEVDNEVGRRASAERIKLNLVTPQRSRCCLRFHVLPFRLFERFQVYNI